MPSSDFNVSSGFTASRPRFIPKSLHTILIANRGEIALRLIRTCKALHLRTVSIYSTADEGAPHTFAADISVHLQGKEADGKGYLDKDGIVSACLKHDVQAVLPGYGFLSENEDFAQKLEDAGIVLCGPRAETMEAFGLKHRARELAQKANVPCVPGTGLLRSVQEAVTSAEKIGFPIMLKSSAGGGGMGLQVCRSAQEVEEAYHTVTSRGKTLFGSADVFMEKFVEKGRHIEVQIFGNGQGHCIGLNERECSIQRRAQKVIEEAPSPFVTSRPQLRTRLTEAATRLGSLVKYRSAGTIEMFVDDDTADFYFLEVNVRLQVEHCVTEITHDIDLVALMLLQAERQVAGQGGISSQELDSFKTHPRGWAIEARLYAEDPIRNYAPSPGILQHVNFADVPGSRVDGWVKTGTTVTASYDPLLAKVIGSGDTREAARQCLLKVLSESVLQGPATNWELLQQILSDKAYTHGATLTSFLTSSDFKYRPQAVEVIEAGVSTSVQDWPARRNVLKGIPEAGPLDALSFQIANLLVGNDQVVEGLEITMTGPTLKFHSPAVVALVGADMELNLDGKPIDTWTRHLIPAGSTLEIGALTSDAVGCRAYLAIRGGLPGIATWMGSKATSAGIGIGGHQGRNLLPGDTLSLPPVVDTSLAPLKIPLSHRWTSAIPTGTGSESTVWTLYAIPGPFDDDTFLTSADRDKLYNQEWKVSPQAARSGTRFDAPLLEWGRSDGGEGGSHPSNILEFSYTPLGINWNGSVPVLLGPDGPDLGGLLITHTVLSTEFRAGQLSPGDSVRFQPVGFATAKNLLEEQEAYLTGVQAFVASQGRDSAALRDFKYTLQHRGDSSAAPVSSILSVIEASSTRPRVEFRAGGDRAIVITYGEMTANILNRVRIELLQRELTSQQSALGITAFSPNVRSLTLYFDPLKTSPTSLIQACTRIEESLPPSDKVKLQVRSWSLPVTFGDPKVAEAVQRYKTTVRNKAIYLSDSPTDDNKPYIARCNGLDSIDDVISAVADTTYVAVSVGFYFGTPILQPLDPRRRLRCQKYNPTRLWTPMGALGLGGSMAAIYGADSAGGYPLIARTIPGWRTFGDIPPFEKTRPWLLSDFDFVKFVPCSQEEYEKALASFLAGTYKFNVEYTDFDAKEQSDFLDSVRDEARAFEEKQAKAMEECRIEEEGLFKAWKEEEDAKNKGGPTTSSSSSSYNYQADPDAVLVKATLAGSVWKIAVQEGQQIAKGDLAVILEAMKTEINIRAPQGFTVKAIVKPPGAQVSPGDVILAGSRTT